MHIRIAALACLLAFSQANAADQLIKLPKPSDLEAATMSQPTSPASQEAAPASASARIAASITQAAQQPAKEAPAKTPAAASRDTNPQEEFDPQDLAAKISARLLALRQRQQETGGEG